MALSVPIEHYTLFKEGVIDSDLSKIVKPLEYGRINSSEIEVISSDCAAPIRESIRATEKSYFETEHPPATSTQDAWLTGRINTMTKTTNTGYVYLSDGSRVYFKLICDKPERYYPVFGHPGMVKIRCIAHMDENLKPTQLDVSEIIPLQIDLFMDTATA